jgi:D-glycerate 3-kinase
MSFELERVRAGFAAVCAKLELAVVSQELLERVYLPLASRLAACARAAVSCQVIGISGAQGTGKSTLAALLQVLLADGFGLRAVCLSLDDYYLPKQDRELLSRTVHPLLATRGVPGTHDVEVLQRSLRRLRAAGPGECVELLRFSKAHDDRVHETQVCAGPFDLVLFEGWCVAARAQSEAELREPINSLERAEDSDGHFRSYVNEQLRGPYAALWTELDHLVFLAAPEFASVRAFRAEQERKLAARVRGAGVMSDEQLTRFIAHFERISREMLRAAPSYADCLVQLDASRAVRALELK